MRFHQLVHTLSYGDAISTEVLGLRRVFREAGHESHIFALNIHPAYKGEAFDVREYPKGEVAELTLHYSLGSPLNELYRNEEQATRTLVFHNLTPAKWFERVNPRIVADLEQGFAELPELCRRSTRVIADSTYNADELAHLGVKAAVLPLTVEPARWSVTANPGIAALLNADDTCHVLSVGRLAPNKCVEDVIRSFAFFHHHLVKKSKLWLVGIDIDTELYSFALKRLVRELLLEGVVHFCGRMADEELVAMYQGCDLFLTMSEHEGFCLPIVEAMHFGLPVVAFASSAVPETLGRGGILIHEKRHPAIAELLHEIVSDQELRARVIAAGRGRVGELSAQHFDARVRELYGLAAR